MKAYIPLFLSALLISGAGAVAAQTQTVYYYVHGDLEDRSTNSGYFFYSDVIAVQTDGTFYSGHRSDYQFGMSLSRQFMDWIRANQEKATGIALERLFPGCELSTMFATREAAEKDRQDSMRRASVRYSAMGSKRPQMVVDIPGSQLPPFKDEEGK